MKKSENWLQLKLKILRMTFSKVLKTQNKKLKKSKSCKNDSNKIFRKQTIFRIEKY